MSVAPDPHRSVEQSVREAIAEELFCPLERVLSESELADLPGLDSVKLLRVITTLEGRYGIVVEDERLYGLTVVSDLVGVIEAELPGRHPAPAP